eukprot:TRINITY_DN9781_c0_g1_i1.p1 TRINITY_DN9781_c0_g1~~TRINITY_DN9781_c0_g1_i1.p1  ORF type:complete len:451 (+),score=74.83 TRINITY_DN9781_c0_g1_i1:98-1450(+)
MNILVSLDQCRAITDWLTQMGAVSLVMPFQKRFCPIALNDTFQMDFRRLQQQLNMHQMDTNTNQNSSMLTDSAENITPPQTNMFEHNVFSPQSSPLAQHQPISMMPTEHLGTADIVQSVNEALPATQDLEGVQNKVEIKQMNNRFWEPIENTLSKGQPAKLTVYGIPAVTAEKELTLEICRSSELFNRGQNAAVKPSLNQTDKATLESKSWKYEREIQEHPFRINVVSADPDILVSQAPRYKAVKSYITKDGQTMLTIEFGVKLEGNSEQNSDSLVVSVLRKNGIKRIFSKSFEIDTYRKSQRPTKKAKRSNGLLSSKDSNEDLDIIPSNNTNVNNAFGATSPRTQHNIPQTPGPYSQMAAQHALLSPLSPPLLEVKQEFAQDQYQYMYEGQTGNTPSLARAMSTDNGELQPVSSPSAFLLDDSGDGSERNVGGDIVDILLGDPGNYFDE